MLDRFAKDNAAVRSHCMTVIKAVAAARPTELRPKFMKMLSEGDDQIRRTAAEILLTTGKPEEVLIEILEHVRSMLGWLRTRILNTLKTFGDDVLRPAAALLEHPDEEIRMQALVLCEHFDDPRLIGPVVKLLDDPDWWLRITACETLAKLKDERVVPHLVKALDDKDTRWAAIDALGHIGGEQALRSLVGLLQDERPEVRMEVLQACSRSKDARLGKLMRQVAENDPSQEVRTRAVEFARDYGSVSPELERSTAAVSSGQLTRPIDKLLAQAREAGASDIQISVGEPPIFRLMGKVTAHDMAPLSAEETRAMVLDILDPVRRKHFEAAGEVDFCHAIPGVGRYRANAFVQRKGTCCAFRCIANVPPTFADLRLPGQLTELLDYHQGLILVSGPAGAGKSTTLAAIVNLINEVKSDHVITLEDPIEFVHPVKNSLVNQREVGRHTAELRPRAPRRAAPGPGRHHGGRAARRRHHPHGPDGRGDGPPDDRDAPHDERGGHGRPADRELPPRRAAAGAHGPLGEPEVRGVAVAGAARRRQGPGRRLRGAQGDDERRHADPRQQDLPAPEPHADLPRGGDADARPEPGGAPRRGAHHAGDGLPPRRQARTSSKPASRRRHRPHHEHLEQLQAPPRRAPPRPPAPPAGVREEVVERVSRPVMREEIPIPVERPSRPRPPRPPRGDPDPRRARAPAYRRRRPDGARRVRGSTRTCSRRPPRRNSLRRRRAASSSRRSSSSSSSST
jgi:HEAT repeat protein